MTIRKFVASDREIYFEMSRSFYQNGAALEPIPDEFLARTFDQVIQESADIEGRILEDEGMVVGYALYFIYWSCEVGGRVLFLDELFICPEQRGKKLGSSFLKWLAETHQDVTAYRLEVCEKNAGAIRLYQKHGYQFLDYRQMRRMGGE